MGKLDMILVLAAVAGTAVVAAGAQTDSGHHCAQHRAAQKAGKAKASVRKATPDSEPVPAGKDGQVVLLTRKALGQIYAGKLDPALLTPAARTRLTPAKVKELSANMRAYGPLKSVTFHDRKPGDSADTCTLKVLLGQTTFIATVKVTKVNKLDDLLLLEY